MRKKCSMKHSLTKTLDVKLMLRIWKRFEMKSFYV